MKSVLESRRMQENSLKCVLLKQLLRIARDFWCPIISFFWHRSTETTAFEIHNSQIRAGNKEDGERLVWYLAFPSRKMGLSISYPPDDYLPAVEDNMGRLFIRSLSFDDMEAEDESPSALLPAFGSNKLIIEGSLSFKRTEAENVQMETTLSISSPKPEREGCSINPNAATAAPSRIMSTSDCPPDSPVIGMDSPRHQAAAVRLQKVYKSFRTRRQLADCAVLVEQRWYNCYVLYSFFEFQFIDKGQLCFCHKGVVVF
jgi:hypothetical protein